MKTIEEYAIDLVAAGAESTAEDDMNEDGEIAADEHEDACDLALEISRAIRVHPRAVLDLVETLPVTSEPDSRYARTDGPIHGHFGLTYASYQVLNRTLMQCMPVEWQERMVACLDELREAYADVKQPESYIIKPAREATYSDLTEAEMRLLGVTRPDAPDFEHDDIPDVYYDDEGTEHDPGDRVFIPTGADPVPHYRRGWVEPGGKWAPRAAEVDG